MATQGTAKALEAGGLAVTRVNKVAEGRPHIVDMIKNGEIVFIINTVEEKRSAIRDSYSIRRAALHFLALAIDNADEERSHAWCVRETEQGLRVMTGRLLACEVVRSKMRARSASETPIPVSEILHSTLLS